ncbi:DVR1 protein, partial [Dasyornis broadbenti]|nr:DVR1 protein [Dasyornis broadbenti]
QEHSLLKSLGLSSKPSPRSPIPVPPVLWRIFHKRKALPRPLKALDSCRVEELNVPGNIVRVFADQGTATAPRPSGLPLRAGMEPRLRSALPGIQSWIPGEIPAARSPRGCSRGSVMGLERG